MTTTFLDPDATVSLSSITAIGAASAHLCLDDSVRQPSITGISTDYLNCVVASGSCVVACETFTIPGGEDVTQVKLWVYVSISNPSINATYNVGVYVGTTMKAESGVVSNTSSFAGWVSVTWSPGTPPMQADIDDLRIRIDTTVTGTVSSYTIQAAYLEVTSAAGGGGGGGTEIIALVAPKTSHARRPCPDARAVHDHGALFHTGQNLPLNARLIAPSVVRRSPVSRPARPTSTGRGNLHTGTIDPEIRVMPSSVASSRRDRRRATVASAQPHLIDWAKRYHQGRGAYRIFAASAYRFYRSSSGPPLETDSPFATSASLPTTPSTTFADGTWYLSMSYFNGVIDSGFLPIGANGETYRVLVVESGAEAGSPPRAPLDVRLELRAGGVVRIIAIYAEEGSLRGDTWAIGYTTNGSTPAEDAPTVTSPFQNTSGAEVLVYDLPAQVHGTSVKVRVQVRRSLIYSDGSTVLVAVADAQGPAAIPGGDIWAGALPDEVL